MCGDRVDSYADDVTASAYYARDIAESAIAAAAAGAAIPASSRRDPLDGRPTADPAVFRQFLPRIHAETNAVINITTGGAHTMNLDQRLATALDVSPEMASCNMGSFNFGLYPLAEKIQDWKYPWEHDYLAASRDIIFRNTFGDIEVLFERLPGHPRRGSN